MADRLDRGGVRSHTAILPLQCERGLRQEAKGVDKPTTTAVRAEHVKKLSAVTEPEPLHAHGHGTLGSGRGGGGYIDGVGNRTNRTLPRV